MFAAGPVRCQSRPAANTWQNRHGAIVIGTDKSIDAVVLMSVGFCLGVPGRGRSLTGIVGMMDRIEHDYPSAEQFDRSAARLQARGLIEVRDDRIALTADGRQLLRETKGGRDFSEQQRRLESRFESAPPADVPAQPLFSDGAFKHALKHHLGHKG
jgi:hypothetical protein